MHATGDILLFYENVILVELTYLEQLYNLWYIYFYMPSKMVFNTDDSGASLLLCRLLSCYNHVTSIRHYKLSLCVWSFHRSIHSRPRSVSDYTHWTVHIIGCIWSVLKLYRYAADWEKKKKKKRRKWQGQRPNKSRDWLLLCPFHNWQVLRLDVQ